MRDSSAVGGAWMRAHAFEHYSDESLVNLSNPLGVQSVKETNQKDMG